MAFTVKKISGATATLLSSSDDNTPVTSLNIANIHATDAAAIDLYYSDSSGSYYLFKGLDMPSGTSLFLDHETIVFPKKYYSLYIKLGASGSTVDVIIRY